MFKIFKKPLIRWTIGGDVSEYGINCLGKSVKSMKSLYGDSFDYVICYNNIESIRLNFDVCLLNQHDYVDSISIAPNTTSWKLYPPRISLQSHEIFIDNDLIIYNKIPLIDKFLKSKNIFFCTEGLVRNFGIYSNDNYKDLKLNSGFFGIPPYFDFSKFIEKKIKKDWSTWFDEQGVVASILSENNLEIITLEEISICLNEFKLGKYGIHFVGLNSYNSDFWEFWLKNQFLKLKI
jgi:hypothetical protein